MNRIILIGNGFDLAHGLKTSYKNFIDDLWEREKINILNSNDFDKIKHTLRYEDDILKIDTNIQKSYLEHTMKDVNYFGYKWFMHNHGTTKILIKNNFLKSISEQSYLENWVDIEEEYYKVLTNNYRSIDNIIELHKDFKVIQELLITYLQKEVLNQPKTPKDIETHILGTPFKDDFINPLKSDEEIQGILFLNFNYTQTVRFYNDGLTIPHELIDIHGELGNLDNPIIFGYGNERDEKYELLEKQNDDRLLSYIKSIRYSMTSNYKRMIRYLNSDEYQVYIFGHSCGLSDGTLLNRLFEHTNCKSIRIFYYSKPDGTDTYNETFINISRNFRNKDLMREIVVSKDNSFAYC